VALIGMMGSGKSHVGARLAHMLELEFYDSDKIIEQKASLKVSEIFEAFGEEKFRASEALTLRELSEKGACIIATGGGAVTNPETLFMLLENAVVIWLDADLEVIWERVQRTEHRPLLKQDNPKDVLSNLMVQRRALYEQAHIRLVTDHEKDEKSGENAVRDVLKALDSYLTR
jgi:shikimate kinase